MHSNHSIHFQGSGLSITCFSCIIVSVNRVSNCSSYWLTLTPAISVRHFSDTFRNIGTFRNYFIKRENKINLKKHFVLKMTKEYVWGLESWLWLKAFGILVEDPGSFYSQQDPMAAHKKKLLQGDSNPLKSMPSDIQEHQTLM